VELTKAERLARHEAAGEVDYACELLASEADVRACFRSFLTVAIGTAPDDRGKTASPSSV
jgi:hypothetical protein